MKLEIETLRRSEPAVHHEVGHHDAVHSHVPVQYPRHTGGKALLFAAVVAIALGALFAYRRSVNHREAAALDGDVHQAAAQLVNLEVVRVRSAAADRALTLPGEARPFRDSAVFARTSGYLAEYHHDIGDRVKEGELLATIETPELDDQITAAKAKIQQLKASVRVAQTQAAFAKSSFTRWEAAAPDGAVSVQERDQKKAELETCNAKVEAADAEVSLAEAEQSRLTTLDKFKRVTAPYDGTITERRVDVGDLITAGSGSSTMPLFRIAQSKQIRVFVDVPQSVASDVTVDMKAGVAFAGRQFEGRVARTADSINLGSRTLRVEVLVENTQHLLLPGTYLQVTFQFNRNRPLLQIPAAALVWRSSGPSVAVIDDGGQVKFRDVKIVSDSGDLVDVDGLTGNERIALNIGSQAADGERVQFHEAEVPAKPATPAPTKGSVAEAPTSR